LGVILLAVVFDFIEHLRMNMKPAALYQNINGLARIEIVVELAMGANAGKGPAIDEAAFPQAPKSAGITSLNEARGIKVHWVNLRVQRPLPRIPTGLAKPEIDGPKEAGATRSWMPTVSPWRFTRA